MAGKKPTTPKPGGPPPKGPEKLEVPNKVLEQINKEFSPTKIEGNEPNPKDPIPKAGYFDNYVFQPNKSLPEEKLLLTGNNLTIPLQISLLEALIYLQDIDLEQWIEQWNNRYTLFTPPETSNYKVSNENLEDVKKIKIATWKQKGLTGESKGIIDTAKPQDFSIVEVWPDKKDEKNSILLSGKKRDIINQIMLIANIKGGGDSVSDFDEGMNFSRKGQPKIVLEFVESTDDVEDGFQPVSARVSFRLMKFTDNPDRADPANTNPLELIKNTDLNRWSNKIQENFYAGNTGYIYKKGKEKFCYHDWENGFSSWLPCKNLADGENLIKAMLRIPEITYNPIYAKHSVSIAPPETYPTLPKKVTLNFGFFNQEEKYLPRKFPIADVIFQRAYILLPTWRQKKLMLFDNGRKLTFD